MFRSSTIIRELALNLAKVIFMLKHTYNFSQVQINPLMMIVDLNMYERYLCVF